MTESELKTYVDVSHEDGVIESEERKLIYNVFDFSDAHAKDIMIPRINMVTVSLDATYDDVLAVSGIPCIPGFRSMRMTRTILSV